MSCNSYRHAENLQGRLLRPWLGDRLCLSLLVDVDCCASLRVAHVTFLCSGGYHVGWNVGGWHARLCVHEKHAADDCHEPAVLKMMASHRLLLWREQS